MLVSPAVILFQLVEELFEFARKPWVNLQYLDFLSFDSQLIPSASFLRLDVFLWNNRLFSVGDRLVAALVVAGPVFYFLVWPKMTQYKWGARIIAVFRNLCCCNGRREDDTSDDKSKLMIEEEQSSEKHDVEDVIKQLEEKQKTINDREADIKKLEQELKTLEIKHQNVVTRCNEEEGAKQEALTRLSQHIALKLADNNPNIADLSDINRPTNLVEKFSQLYDDEWTEAFDALQQLPEYRDDKETIKLLLDFVMYCFRLCREKSSIQLKSWLGINGDSLEMDKVPTEMKKLMKETRKKCAGLYFPLISKIAIESLKENHGGAIQEKAVDFYLKRCIELCWLMSVQDPPMALSVDLDEERKYNKLKFREYTKVGPFIEFVIWPAVLIQDGGDLMAKGVAQGCESIIEPKLQTVPPVFSGQENKEDKCALMAEKSKEDNGQEINFSRENVAEEKKKNVADESSINKNEAKILASWNGDLSQEGDANQFRGRRDAQIDTDKPNSVSDKTAVVKQENDNVGTVREDKDTTLEKIRATQQERNADDYVKTPCEETKLLQIKLQVKTMGRHDPDSLNNSEEEEQFNNNFNDEADEINTKPYTNGSGIPSEIEEIEELLGNLDCNTADVSLQENGEKSKHRSGPETEMNQLLERKPGATENEYKEEEKSEEVSENQSYDTADKDFQKNEQKDEVSDETEHKKDYNYKEESAKDIFEAQENSRARANLQGNREASKLEKGQENEINLLTEWKPEATESERNEEERAKENGQNNSAAGMSLQENGEKSKHQNEQKTEMNQLSERKPGATENKYKEEEKSEEISENQSYDTADNDLQKNEQIDEVSDETEHKKDYNYKEEESAKNIFEAQENSRADANSQGNREISKLEKSPENEINLLTERKPEATDRERNEEERAKENGQNNNAAGRSLQENGEESKHQNGQEKEMDLLSEHKQDASDDDCIEDENAEEEI